MEEDPLLAKAEVDLYEAVNEGGVQTTVKHRSAVGIVHRVAIFLIPMVQFILSFCLLVYVSHDHPYMTTAMIVCFLFSDGAVYNLGHQRWVKHTGMVAFIGVVCAVVLSVVAYTQAVIFFFGYRDLRTYTNVLASQGTAQFVDGGMILFNHGTKPDASRSAGFKNFFDGGNRYCIAPIVDQDMDSTSKVAFWAVGKNCCGARGNFDCGDIHDPLASSGVVILRPDMFVPPHVKGMLPMHEKMLAQFEKSVKYARSAFEMNVPDDPKENIFVQWTRRPFDIQRGYKTTGDLLVVLNVLLFGSIFGANAALRVFK